MSMKGGGEGGRERGRKGGREREVGKGVSGALKVYSLRLWSDYK